MRKVLENVFDDDEVATRGVAVVNLTRQLVESTDSYCRTHHRLSNVNTRVITSPATPTKVVVDTHVSAANVQHSDDLLILYQPV